MNDLSQAARPAGKSLLTITRDGPAEGQIWLILHDRHGDLADARALGQRLAPKDGLRISVRSARTQTRGSIAPPKGHFWFIGGCAKPELTTLGDGLYQLDLLTDDLERAHAARPLHLLAEGEGGVMAMLLALMRPGRFARVILVNVQSPESLSRIPLELGPRPWPVMRLIDSDAGRLATTAMQLQEFGIEIETGSGAFSL